MLKSLFLLLYLITIIIYSLKYFKKKFEVNLKFFLGFLVSMLFFELLAHFVGPFRRARNTWVYNLLTLAEFNFLLLFLKEILLFRFSKKIVKYFIIIFNIIYFLSSFYYTYKGVYLITYNSLASVSGGFIVTVAVFLFFKDFINSDRVMNLRRSLPFWISVGLLLYYLDAIPGTLMMNAFSKLEKKDIIFIKNIAPFLALVMYCVFIFGALWSQKKE